LYKVRHGVEGLAPFVDVRNGLFATKEWAEGMYRFVKGDYNLVPRIAIEDCLSQEYRTRLSVGIVIVARVCDRRLGQINEHGCLVGCLGVRSIRAGL